MVGLSTGILRVVGNDDLRRQEEEARKAEADARQQQPLILNLAAYLRRCWDAAKLAKKPIEDIMLAAKRQRNGEYEPDKLADICTQGGSQIFIGITEVKCRAAESWIRDILLDGGAPPWDLQPTPIPKLSPETEAEVERAFTQKLLQALQATGQAPDPEQFPGLRELAAQEIRMGILRKAQEKADRMTDKIKDQFAEGGWYEAFNEFVTDLTTYPAACLKGPVIRRQMTLGWEQGPDGKTQVKTSERLAPEYERVDPFRLYPEPGISRVDDGYMFEHHKLSRSDLAALVGVPGYDDDAIKEVLKIGPRASWFFMDSELSKNLLENKHQSWTTPTDQFDALEFWGKISGSMLIEWGMDEAEVGEPEREYDACVWLIGNYVIKALLNYDPLGQKPYAFSSFFKVPGALWGKGIPQAISDIQNICNAAARSLVNNMGIASGPQVEIEIDRLPANEDITTLRPWKIWQTNSSPSGERGQAVHFNQPDDRSGPLMQVYERFAQLADEHSGVPSYVSGDISVTGAGRTSSGLSMLMGAAGKGIRQIVSYIDNDVIKVIVERQFVFNMRYDEDEEIKGDCIVVPRGATNLAVKETNNVRKLEFLNATMNPLDAEILGKDGRAAILRDLAKSLNMVTDDVVPTREKIEFSNMTMASMPNPAGNPQPNPQQLDPSGNPMGGQAGKQVTNMTTGVS